MITLTTTNVIKSYPIRDNIDILKMLLKDRTTRKNIIWATDSYQDFGEGYQAKDHIKESLFKNGADQLIKPRVEKNEEEQSKRTRGKGEVFTPTWIIKKKIDLIEEELSKLDLEDYVDQRWLEITCGEAPYMTSRYDTVTGQYLDINERVGFLDRKLQRISKEIENEELWFSMVLKAYQTSYGYEYQGDSLLIARENLLNSFLDYYVAKFNHIPEVDKLEAIARIISYNVFQMDGLKYRIPIAEKIRYKELDLQLSFFGDPEMGDQQLEMVVEGEDVKVRNWINDKMIKFKDLLENEGRVRLMKFDVVIGNPPYQADAVGANNQRKQIYHLFIDEAAKISIKSILITPARYLFNTGGTPKSWNKKMLENEHLKIIYYEADSNKVFENVQLKGGVAISYMDNTQKFEPIKLFIADTTLSDIYHKVLEYEGENFDNLGQLVFSPDSYRFEDKMFEQNPNFKSRTDSSHLKSVSSNVFERYPEVFSDYVEDNTDYIQIYGREDSSVRKFKYILKNYVRDNGNIDKWKLFIPGASGNGIYGEVLGKIIVASPSQAHNQTFLSMGNFERKFESESLLKYLKSKFGRALLGIMKSTHNNQSQNTWSAIPLQDFTSKSDIDWTKSIAKIDQQLYKKYGLEEEEINFIESNVKEME